MANEQPMTLKMDGREYALVPLAEYHRLKAVMPVKGLDLLLGGTRESVAHSIRTRRQALGLTQIDLARLSNVRNETISRIEQRQVAADLTTVNALDMALNKAEGDRKNGGE